MKKTMKLLVAIAAVSLAGASFAATTTQKTVQFTVYNAGSAPLTLTQGQTNGLTQMIPITAQVAPHTAKTVKLILTDGVISPAEMVNITPKEHLGSLPSGPGVTVDVLNGSAVLDNLGGYTVKQFNAIMQGPAQVIMTVAQN